jgi:hypothetical protein
VHAGPRATPWLVAEGVDYLSGSHIAALTDKTFQECGEACMSTPDCFLFTHSNTTDDTGKAGQCWLKNAVSSLIPDSHRRNSGVLVSECSIIMAGGCSRWKSHL